MVKERKCLAVLIFFLMLPVALAAQGAKDYLTPLNSARSTVRMNAAQEAGNKRVKGAVPRLIVLLKDSSPGVVINSVVALGQLRDARAVKPLIDVVEKSTSPAVKTMALQALGYFKDEKVVELLNRMADDKSPLVRSAACRSLGKVGNEKDADKLLERAKKDEDGHVRKVALGALGEMAEMKDLSKKMPEIEKTMEDAAKGKDEKTRRSAEKELKRIKREK